MHGQTAPAAIDLGCSHLDELDQLGIEPTLLDVAADTKERVARYGGDCIQGKSFCEHANSFAESSQRALYMVHVIVPFPIDMIRPCNGVEIKAGKD